MKCQNIFYRLFKLEMYVKTVCFVRIRTKHCKKNINNEYCNFLVYLIMHMRSFIKLLRLNIKNSKFYLIKTLKK